MTFIFTIVFCDLFIATQHFYVPPRLRLLAAFVFVAFAFAGYFYLVRPEPLFPHARWVALMCGLVCLAIIIVQDILVRHMITPKFLLVAVIAGTGPLAGAGLYHVIRTRLTRSGR